MKLARILCWLLLPLMIGTVQACCNCADEISYRFIVNKIEIANLDNSGISPVPVQGDAVNKKAYCLRIAMTTTKVAFQKNVTPNLFVQTASAQDCFCNGGFYGQMTDTLLSLHIYTVNDFDSTHKAGSEINSYFFSDGRYPLAANGSFNQPLYSYDFASPSYVYNYMLMHEPQFSSLCQFKVEINFSDNKKYELLTQPINLL
jgi:hypothetical protein